MVKPFICPPILVFCLLISCGSETNIIGRSVPDSHKKNFFHSLDMAQSLYDQGRLSEAKVYAQNAYSIDPDSEEASVLFGFINLSLAGGDPFSLAKGLIAAENERKKAANSGANAGDANTSDTLGAIKDAVGFTAAEIESLGTKDTSDILYPVLFPKCAEEARLAVQRLVYVNDAIRAVCPFVDKDILSTTDSRHFCQSTSRPRLSANKAHFLWAFTHLTEAIAFNAVLTYKNEDATDNKSNLEKRVQKVQSIDVESSGNIDSLLTSLESIEATVNSIFPADGACSDQFPTSQLQATLSDMLAVDRGFAKIVGIPKGIATSIVKAVAKFNVGGEGGVSAKLAAIKSDFTKKVSAGLSSKIDLLVADPANPLDSTKKDQFCSILDSISSGTNPSKACK